MSSQAFNPFLPSDEYIPDGEPRIFGDRVYLYGSHDKFNGAVFCLNDYVCYSAPLDNLGDWRWEGVIYRKRDDPGNRLGLRLLFAPDVVQGPDGRYYLYYGLDFSGLLGVAVCNNPAGRFRYLGCVRFPDGRVWGRRRGDFFPFDPGVLVDDNGQIYLYAGFGDKVPRFFTGFCKLKSNGGVVAELHKDMLTIKGEPRLLFPREGAGSFPGHEFYEASSIRKINGKYYFVYSSRHNHELCYAVGKGPMGAFEFKGPLISLGDLIFDRGSEDKAGLNYLGNTHGGLLHHRGRWFIFYHRQTNRHSFSRQACAEELFPDEKGDFIPAKVTSCGLNDGPLRGQGMYDARIACNLWSKKGVRRYDTLLSKLRLSEHPYITQISDRRDGKPYQYIANMKDGATAGFKFFELTSDTVVTIKVRGRCRGRVVVFLTDDFNTPVAEILVVSPNRRQWRSFSSIMGNPPGVYPLYFQYRGSGRLDFYSFAIQ